MNLSILRRFVLREPSANEDLLKSRSPVQGVLLLGSNMGDSIFFIEKAISKIAEKFEGIRQVSKLYKTAPWGKKDQSWFFNQAIKLDLKALEPMDVLQQVLEIERVMGRHRQEKWGARMIDIDILLIDGVHIDVPGLTIPHPYLHERRFSLIPLMDLWPNWEHPILKQTVGQMLENCPDKGEVIPIS